MNSLMIALQIPRYDGDTEDIIADRTNEAIRLVLREIDLGDEEMSVRAEMFHPFKNCPALSEKHLPACTCPFLWAHIFPIGTKEEETFYLLKVKKGESKLRTHGFIDEDDD